MSEGCDINITHRCAAQLQKQLETEQKMQVSHEGRVGELRDKLQNLESQSNDEILATLKRDPKTSQYATERTKEVPDLTL
jgi:hypothetical protein